MSSKTLTRIELSEAVYKEVGLSHNESAELVETVLNHISNALIKGEQVKISAFGTFSTRNKKQRIGRNPKTGKEIPITSRRVISFKASQIMKEKVAAGNK